MQPKKRRTTTGPSVDPEKDLEVVLSNMDVYDKITHGSLSRTVPELVYKITAESDYIEDPNNGRLKIIKDWYQRITVENQTQIRMFVENSSL